MNVETLKEKKLREFRMRIDVTDPFCYGMKKIKLRGKDLEQIPRELFTIDDLEVLDLSPERESCLFHRLPAVPPMICRLTNLKILMLDTNDIFDIPPELCLLKSLEKLSLSNNNIANLPLTFAKLSKLKSLHCGNNRLIAFPIALCSLEYLEFLDLSDNMISDIPPQINQLQNLQTLIMFVNQLVGLPEEICQLSNLRCLWVGNNKIHRLPRNFGSLRKLDWGRGVHMWSTVIEGNPLEDPPLEICARGVKAIEKYFKDTEEGDY